MAFISGSADTHQSDAGCKGVIIAVQGLHKYQGLNRVEVAVQFGISPTRM